MKLRAFALSLSLLSVSSFAGPALAEADCHGNEADDEAVVPAAFEGDRAFLSASFQGSDGKAHRLSEAFTDNDYLVVTFFSSTCPCQSAHDSRLKDLYAQWSHRKVAFLSVDSEANSSLSADVAEAKRRGYPFPILSDVEGKLADALGARFATYTVILDKTGAIRYRGGLDSDKSHLTENARHYVRTALSQLLAGQSPNPAEGKALGCFLKRR